MMGKKKVYPTRVVNVYNKHIFDAFSFAKGLYSCDREDGVKAIENASNYLREHLDVNCVLYAGIDHEEKSIKVYLFEDVKYEKGRYHNIMRTSCGTPYFELEYEDKEVTPRECVANFAVAMEEKLRANEHRGGWESLSIDFLTYRLREEMGELFRALAIYYANPHELGAKAVKDECADVANFAMMITDLVEKGRVRDEK